MAESRTFAKGVVISHGILTMIGDLETARTKADDRDGGANVRAQSCCPVDAANGAAIPVESSYTCPNHPGQLFKAADVAKAVKKDGELQLIGSAEDLKAARAAAAGGDKKSLELHPHRASEVARHTIMGQTSYVFRPSTRSPLHGVLSTLIGQDGRISCEDGEDRVLLGTIQLSGTSKLVMLRAWGDELLIQQLEWPGNLKAFDPISHDDVQEGHLALTRTLIQETSEPFTTDLYASATQAGVGAFIQERLADPSSITVPTPTASAASSGGDLMAALQASIDAAKAAKAPAEPAAPAAKPARKTTKKVA